MEIKNTASTCSGHQSSEGCEATSQDAVSKKPRHKAKPLPDSKKKDEPQTNVEATVVKVSEGPTPPPVAPTLPPRTELLDRYYTFEELQADQALIRKNFSTPRLEKLRSDPNYLALGLAGQQAVLRREEKNIDYEVEKFMLSLDVFRGHPPYTGDLGQGQLSLPENYNRYDFGYKNYRTGIAKEISLSVEIDCSSNTVFGLVKESDYDEYKDFGYHGISMYEADGTGLSKEEIMAWVASGIVPPHDLPTSLLRKGIIDYCGEPEVPVGEESK